MYNMSKFSNSSGMLDFIQAVNEHLMFNWLGVIFLVAIVVICFMAFFTATNDVRKAVMASSFIGFGMCLFLKAMSLIPNLAVFICLIIAAISVAWSFSND